MKKLFVLLLASAMTAVTLTSCASTGTTDSGSTGGDSSTGGESAEGKEVVRVVVPGISEESTTDPISGIVSKGLPEFESFLEEQIPDYDIELISIPWDGWIQKLEAMVLADEMDVGFFTNQVAVPDWYEDLTPYLEGDDTVNLETMNDIFVEPAVHYSYYKTFNYPEATNQIFGLPMTMACNVIVYDKVLFEQWGMPEPEAGVTMEELVEMSTQMTGTNPETGAQNYGGYASPYWMEWFLISYDAVKPVSSDTMMLNELDMAEYVDYIADSPEVLDYFTQMETIVANSPEGVATGAGSEKFFTADNDIAINFNVNGVSSAMQKYLIAEQTDVTDRFIPIVIPAGANGEQGFPEFFRFSVTKGAANKDAAWDVVKTLTTDPEIIDFYLENYASDKVSALADPSSIEIMQTDYNQMRLAHQEETIFITDDYWYWRTPVQSTNNLIISKELTAEEARTHFYDGVVTWVNDTKAQLGQ